MHERVALCLTPIKIFNKKFFLLPVATSKELEPIYVFFMSYMVLTACLLLVWATPTGKSNTPLKIDLLDCKRATDIA